VANWKCWDTYLGASFLTKELGLMDLVYAVGVWTGGGKGAK